MKTKNNMAVVANNKAKEDNSTMKKPDYNCFAFVINPKIRNHCTALDGDTRCSLECGVDHNCSFYKTHEQQAAELRKCADRLEKMGSSKLAADNRKCAEKYERKWEKLQLELSVEGAA